HFAICGFSGTGKSFLINSLRGLTPYTPNSAPTGQIETTLTPTRYPDPRTTSPYFRFVWYDIPGAGTLNIPAAQYFIDMGLYIFDFIVLVYGDRFTEVDAAVLEHARRFDVPVFVVRSRAD
ncbi:P-loop containing nucleoside triphosphate hydrolase protein, partial [Ascodesmis nigricans]